MIQFNSILTRTLHHQSYRKALKELERALGDQHAKSLEESLRILLEEHAIEIKMVRSEAQRTIEVNASETHTRLGEVRACVRACVRKCVLYVLIITCGFECIHFCTFSWVFQHISLCNIYFTIAFLVIQAFICALILSI